VPLHLQKAYSWMGYEAGDFPVAEEAIREIVSLPMFPGLSEEMQRRVVAQVARFVTGHGAKKAFAKASAAD